MCGQGLVRASARLFNICMASQIVPNCRTTCVFTGTPTSKSVCSQVCARLNQLTHAPQAQEVRWSLVSMPMLFARCHTKWERADMDGDLAPCKICLNLLRGQRETSNWLFCLHAHATACRHKERQIIVAQIHRDMQNTHTHTLGVERAKNESQIQVCSMRALRMR